MVVVVVAAASAVVPRGGAGAAAAEVTATGGGSGGRRCRDRGCDGGPVPLTHSGVCLFEARFPRPFQVVSKGKPSQER